MRWLALALLIGLASLWPISKSTTFQLFGDAIDRIDTDQRVVALTFDDGPSRKHTAAVLDTLAKADVQATFFLTGHEAAQNPDELNAIIDGGHAVGNHSFSHDRLILKSASVIRAELDQTDAILREAGAADLIPFRPPYGQKLFSLPFVLSKQNRPSIMWDIAPDDAGRTPLNLAAEIVERAEPGSIILMHVMYDSRETSRAALPLVIEGLRHRGFEFVTVNALLDLAQER